MIGFLPFRSGVEFKKMPWATLLFMGICSLVHLFTWRIVATGGSMDWLDMTGYHYWFPPSALSCIFIHANFEHLFFNLMFFFVFAAPLELAEGRKKFWLLVAIGALVSCYFSTLALWVFSCYPGASGSWISEARLNGYKVGGIGASGVVSAFAFAYLVRFWRKRMYVYLTVFGVPIPKQIPLAPWVMVLAYMLLRDAVFGVLFQGIYPVSGTGHFAHLGGYLAGGIMAFHWGLRGKQRRDYYLEQAEELAQAPLTGAYAAYVTYKQALECDPGNGKILLELARQSHGLSRSAATRDEQEAAEKWRRESGSHYRKAVETLSREQNEAELAEAYAEAYERTGLEFHSERQLELARLLLKAGKWKTAGKVLEDFCRDLKAVGQGQGLLYLRAGLIQAWVLDHYERKISEAREMMKRLAHEFPNQRWLARAREDRAGDGDERELLYFNPDRPGFPFSRPQPEAKAPPRPKLNWRRVRPDFVFKATMLAVAVPVALMIGLWLFIILAMAAGGLGLFWTA